MMDIVKEKQAIGQFQCNGAMWVTDPCYKPDTWCLHKLERVQPGTWNSYALKASLNGWGNRVTELVAWHGEEIDVDDKRWQPLPEVTIGVDSGQAGFFSGEVAIGSGEYGEKGTFYGDCCDATNSKRQAGIIHDTGVVSHSGLGDGSYDLYVVYREGKVVATKLVFIGDEEFEDDDEF